MSLPPALLARLAQRGLVNKQKAAQKENGKTFIDLISFIAISINAHLFPRTPRYNCAAFR